MRKRLVTGDEARPAKTQHTKPCGDCPWRVDALPGWLGADTPEGWLQIAHSETKVDCHTRSGAQCAGLATYRANVCKLPRHPDILRLPADRQKVFPTPMAFIDYHGNDEE